MRVACLGGGPAGLYFAITMKLRNPDHEIVVIERNRPDDTFGWGVVLSDETLDNLAKNDPVSAASIRAHFAYWDDIAVNYRGTRTVSSGHGFCGIGRKALLILLQQRARELGIDLRFETEAENAATYARDYDLVVAADGLNSKTRREFADDFKPEIDIRKCKFVWLGTHQKFDDAFTFVFEETEHGWVWAHAYQFDDDTATFIVECAEETWEKFGFGEMTQEQSIATCEQIFKDTLGGYPLMSNAAHIRGSAWLNFPRVLCERWHHENVVLLGDAAATAHFSIGSGTKLALESAIALANYVETEDTLEDAFRKYEDERRVEVLKLQSAARNSCEWFEEIERYFHLDPVQFNYSLLTRSQRISHENLRLRDKAWLESAEAWFQQKAGAPANVVRRPMFAPYSLRDLKLKNRVVVSPMDQYQGRRRLPDRLAFRPLRRAGERRRGPRLYRDDVREPGGAHHAGLHRPLRARARGRLEAHRRFRACGNRGAHLLPARPFRRQGLNAARLGGDGRAAQNRELAGHVGLGNPLVAAQSGSEGHGSRRHGAGEAPVRAVGGDGGARRLRHAGASLRARLFPLLLHHAGHQHTAPTNMAEASRTACAIRSKSSTRCARSGWRASRSRCASRPTTGSATKA